MAKLYELATNFRNILELVEDDSIDFETIQIALQAVEADIAVKAENIVKLDASLKGDEEAVKAEIKRLTARKKAIENRRESFRKYLKEQLEAINIKKIKCGVFNISVKDNPPALEIEDEKLIPAKYQTIIPKHYEIQRDAIKEALKAGKKVRGAKLTVGTSLCIR